MVKKITKKQKVEILFKYRQGLSSREIAKQYPFGKTAIWNLLSNSNVKMRTSGNSYRKRKYNINHSTVSSIVKMINWRNL